MIETDERSGKARGRGRPTGPSKDRLLESAEELFAAHGFDAVSLRTIAAEAGVKPSLLLYHYGSKEELYREVWRSWFSQPDLRQESLKDFKPDSSIPIAQTVELIVHSFFAPPIALLTAPRGKNLLAILARELSDPKEQVRGLLEQYLNPSNTIITNALRAALPELDDMSTTVGFTIMSGAAQKLILEFDQTSRRSGGVISEEHFSTSTRQMIKFVSAGFLALGRIRV